VFFCLFSYHHQGERIRDSRAFKARDLITLIRTSGKAIPYIRPPDLVSRSNLSFGTDALICRTQKLNFLEKNG
jgi:hypothetical protein